MTQCKIAPPDIRAIERKKLLTGASNTQVILAALACLLTDARIEEELAAECATRAGEV